MIDLKGWAQRSPIAAWASFIFTILLAANGFVNGVLDVYTKATALLETKNPIAIISGADFQSTVYSSIDVTFRNPTKETKSFTDVMFECTTHDNSRLLLNTANNIPAEWTIFKELTLTPFSLKAGEPMKVRFIIFDPKNKVNQICKSLRPVWTNSNVQQEKGDPIEIPKGSVTFSDTIMKRS